MGAAQRFIIDVMCAKDALKLLKRQMLFDFMEKYEYQLVYSEEGMFVYQ